MHGQDLCSLAADTCRSRGHYCIGGEACGPCLWEAIDAAIEKRTDCGHEAEIASLHRLADEHTDIENALTEKVATLRDDLKAVVEAVSDLVKAIPPIEGHAFWSIDRCRNSPSSHQEMVRQDVESANAWEKAKRKVSCALARPGVRAVGVRSVMEGT